MLLNSAGELLVNTTSDAGAYALQVAGSIYNTTGADIGASSGSLRIGTTVTNQVYGTTPILQVAGDAGFGIFQRFQNNSFGSVIGFTKSRNSTKGSHTILQDADQLGRLGFFGSDGSAFIPGATIESSIDGTPSSNVMPARLQFFTTPAASGTPSERMRITSGGNVGIGTISPVYKLAINTSTAAGTYGNSIEWQKYNNASAFVGISYDDTNDGLSFNASVGVVGFNRQYMFINRNTGNVGIGTTNPVTNLDIKASISGAYTTSSSQAPLRIYNVTNAGGINSSVITFQSSTDNESSNPVARIGVVGESAGTNLGAMIMMTRDASGVGNSVIYDDGTNVGIGTTSPATVLHVAGNAQVKSTTGTVWSRASNDSGEFYLGIDNSAGSGFTGTAYARFLYANNAYPLAIFTNDQERMRITSGGNVGIGTTSPNLAGSNTALTVNTTNAADYSALELASGGALNFYINGNNSANYISSQGSRPLLIFTNSNERMRITSTGNVGIGITSPGYKLEVNGEIALPSTIRLINGGGTITYINESYGINLNGDDTHPVQVDTTLLVGYVASGGSYGTNDAYIAGSVGIGTTSPSYKLDVDGDIRATADIIAYSDARVKENIKTVKNALNKVTSLRGVSYTRKDIDDKSEKIGVIAQEVLDVLPQVVQQDIDGNYSVAYGNMVGVLIEAIKELTVRLDKLENK